LSFHELNNFLSRACRTSLFNEIPSIKDFCTAFLWSSGAILTSQLKSGGLLKRVGSVK
jgi:hypothetical protein